MDASASGEFLRFFSDLPDPRGCNRIHKLHDMLIICVMAVICGADGWAQVEQFGNAKKKWFSTFLALPNGIPSHDTFGRVFAALDPNAFERCFLAWMNALVQATGGKLIAIDGKAIRRSFKHAWDKSGMAHMVSAFARNSQMVFAQLAVEEKSNEIDAIPKILDLLDIKGALATIDAMGCQKKIARKIIEGGGDYVLSLKGNHPKLRQKAKALLTEAVLDFQKTGQNHCDGSDDPNGPVRYDVCQSVDGDHGRIETRAVIVTNEIEALGPAAAEWPGLKSVAMIQSTRELNGKKTTEHRFYISSLGELNAAKMADAVRGHWSVENQLHWQLDVSFNEDQRRIRKGHGAENFSRLCRLALNLLKREKTRKVGIKTKRLVAGWDENYLLKLLVQ